MISDLNGNTILYEEIDAEDDILQEIIAISIAEHYPHLVMSTIRYMVRKFKGRQDELMDYLDNEKARYDQLVYEIFDNGHGIIKMNSDSLEFCSVEEEFSRMTANMGNMSIRSIDIVRNKKLEKTFEIEQLRMKNRGFSDTASLLFPVTCPPDIKEVLDNNFKSAVVKVGFFSDKVGVLLTDTPKVQNVDMMNGEERYLLMCLVLAGNSVADGEGNILVKNVNNILPKYVVHFCQRRKE